MTINELKGKRITVMGLGLHGGGVGTVRFLSLAGAKVTVTDIKSKEELAPSLAKLKEFKNVSYVFRQHRPENFTQTDMVIKNPAAPWSNKYIQLAIQNKIPVEMDSSLFFKFCKKPIIGVTGSKGKTTTTSLIYEILVAAGKNPLKVGIGQTSVLDKIKNLKKDSIVVFELSSWRLSALGRYKISPQVSVITNVSPDHLNYYKSMEGYIQDKKNIFLYQKKDDYCIVNEDNAIIRELESEIKSKIIKFSKNKVVDGKAVYLDKGIIYFNNGIDEKKILEVKDIKLRGEHNLENVLAAIATVLSLGVKIEVIRTTIIKFREISHRLEFVRELKGVKYYNDTAATAPEAAIHGINSFSEPIILICGGSDKNLDMFEFAKIIVAKTKEAIFLKGKGTDKIISDIKKSNPQLATHGFQVLDSIDEALASARSYSQEGDVVLLSPGAASFGLFTNEIDRGDKFKEAVMRLK